MQIDDGEVSSMLRAGAPARLLVSARGPDDVLYGDDQDGALRMSHLDGNAAGALRDVFAADVTTAIATCAGCGATAPLANVHVYEGAGIVLRCDAVLLRLVRRDGETCVATRGLRLLRIGAR